MWFHHSCIDGNRLAHDTDYNAPAPVQVPFPDAHQPPRPQEMQAGRGLLHGGQHHRLISCDILHRDRRSEVRVLT